MQIQIYKIDNLNYLKIAFFSLNEYLTGIYNKLKFKRRKKKLLIIYYYII